MKNLRSLSLFCAAVALLLVGAGCENITTTRGGNPDRVIAGKVYIPGGGTLPADAEVVVRLIDTAGMPVVRNAASSNLPVGDRARVEPVAQVLGEQVIRGGGETPVAFRFEYRADDSLLRHGLNLEARVSIGGRIRMRTVNFRAVTLGNAADTHEVSVETVAR